MRSATFILGLVFVATVAAIPVARAAAVEASGLARRDVASGEEGTADEDVTWNADLYAAGAGERRFVLDPRGEEETADEDVTWNVNVYGGDSYPNRHLSGKGDLPEVTGDSRPGEQTCDFAIHPQIILDADLADTKSREMYSLRSVTVVVIVLVGSGCLTIVGATIGGIGADLTEVDTGTIVRFRKIAFASEFFYIFTVGIVKLSLLLYYRRIFVLSLVSPRFRRMNDIVLGVAGLWMLAFFITTLLQARPISWNWTEVGSVSNLHDFFICEAVTNIALDLTVLCMPMLIVYRMCMSLRKKILVVGIFGLGFFCVIASAIRLYYVTKYFTVSVRVNPGQFEDTVANLDLWSLIEPCSSTICICLPCLGPLFRGGRSPSSLVASIRAIFSLGSESSSQYQVNRDQSSKAEDSFKLDTLQATEQLVQNDGHSQQDTHHPNVNKLSDLEGQGARVFSNH
uniref:Rhodopsin domain-containing protein n=1 Tax=Talaromyces marneffei PM1 TaxID=1077442 RepID=A0A093VKE7_TALMA